MKRKKKNSFLPLDIREYEKKRIIKSKYKKYFLINYFKYLKKILQDFSYNIRVFDSRFCIFILFEVIFYASYALMR